MGSVGNVGNVGKGRALIVVWLFGRNRAPPPAQTHSTFVDSRTLIRQRATVGGITGTKGGGCFYLRGLRHRRNGQPRACALPSDIPLPLCCVYLYADCLLQLLGVTAIYPPSLLRCRCLRPALSLPISKSRGRRGGHHRTNPTIGCARCRRLKRLFFSPSLPLSYISSFNVSSTLSDPVLRQDDKNGTTTTERSPSPATEGALSGHPLGYDVFCVQLGWAWLVYSVQCTQLAD